MTMFRKVLIVLLMAPLFAAAVAAGVSLPVLVLMFSLFLIALVESSTRKEQQK
jgi:predicted ABC-type exoprotein transport system permease subunit